ncbi:5960_t:CDS:1, partial [Entrophospora sp. SA101]
SININYSLPNIRNDYQSVYKFNNSSDIGLIATSPNENIFSTNFLFDYQNKGQHFIDISNYEINNNDNYINNLNNFNANNSNNNHLNNIDSNNFNFNNTDNSYNLNFNSNHSNDFISNNDTH